MELIGDLRRSCEVREVRTAGDRLIVACGREETDSVVSFFESHGYTTEQINVAEKLYDGRIAVESSVRSGGDVARPEATPPELGC